MISTAFTLKTFCCNFAAEVRQLAQPQIWLRTKQIWLRAKQNRVVFPSHWAVKPFQMGRLIIFETILTLLDKNTPKKHCKIIMLRVW